MANTPNSNPMSQARYTAKTRRPFSTGAGALLKECDQQHRSDAHDLPSGRQQIERTSSECEQRSEREQVQQKEEAQKTALAMQVGRRELPDQSGKHNRQSEEWQRKTVCQQHQREMVIVHGKPVAERHHDGRSPCRADFQTITASAKTQAENVRPVILDTTRSLGTQPSSHSNANAANTTTGR